MVSVLQRVRRALQNPLAGFGLRRGFQLPGHSEGYFESQAAFRWLLELNPRSEAVHRWYPLLGHWERSQLRDHCRLEPAQGGLAVEFPEASAQQEELRRELGALYRQ